MRQIRFHIWRYDQKMPRVERPWVVTVLIDREALPDPEAFETWAEAATYVRRYIASMRSYEEWIFTQ
jgi:hypothetical protein